MQLTEYDAINDLLEELLHELQVVLRERLVGLYLYGSLVWGDFDMEISDMDLLAAVSEHVSTAEFSLLDQLHNHFVEKHENWADRIEIAYVPVQALRTFKTRRSEIAIMSPGEPFHIKEAGNDWLINWYMVRERGKTILGVDPRKLIAPISKREFIAGVKKQALDWRDWVGHTRTSRPYQGYAILTMCRALYACRKGEQVSKKKAAQWVMQELPEKAGLIQRALQWREEHKAPHFDDEATYPETVEFVNFLIDHIVG